MTSVGASSTTRLTSSPASAFAMPDASMSDARVWNGAVIVHLPSCFFSEVVSPASFFTVSVSMLSEARPVKSFWISPGFAALSP